MQLLFCNTFVCDSTSPAGNWAVVKFPCMIAVDEVWIIPPGAKVHSQLPDDQYVGKTSPNNFRVEFFSDDRSASMTTYDHVGSMEYSEGSPNRFHPSSALYSEKLLLNGWFNQITVAVYGGILSDIGSNAVSTSNLDLNIKTPTLIIHEKPEGRSVYIRGAPNIPQLTKDDNKPEPLMPSLLSTSESEFLLGRGKTYPDLEEEINMGNIDDLSFPGENIGFSDMQHVPYYDRRQTRNKGFGMKGGRMPQKNYLNDRSDFSRNTGPRETLLPENDSELGFRTDNSERPSYRDRNRGIMSSNQHSHGRHETIDNSDLTSQKFNRVNDRQSNIESKRDFRATQDSNEVKDLRHSLERNREENSASEDLEKERNPEWMVEEYEEISDEDIEEERVAALHEMEELMDADLFNPASTMCFNPFLMEPVHLIHFNHPDMTDFEITCNMLLMQQDDENSTQNGLDVDVARFESLTTKASKMGKMKNLKSDCPTLILNAEQGKDWVSVIEEFIPLISTALPVFWVTSREKYEEYLSLLFVWVFTGLDSALSSTQSIGTNLRMLKCGINLAHKLCQTTQDVVTSLTASGLDDKLITLLCMDNMASSIKIMIIHTLDAYLSWPSSLNKYFNEERELSTSNYTRLIEMMLKPQAARVATGLSRLVNKVSLFHTMWRLRNTVQTLVSEKIPNAEDEYDFDDDYLVDDTVEEVVLEEEEMVVMSSTSDDEEEDDHHFRHPEGRSRKIMKQYDNHEDDPSLVIPHTPPENTTIPLEAAICVQDATISDNDVADIKESLGMLTTTLQNVKTTITQLPKRSFPTISSQCEISDKQTLACCFRMLEFYQVLPSVQALLCTPVISGIQEVYDAAYKFLDYLMSRQDGLLFLSSNFSSVSCIIRHLLSSTANLSTVDIETVGTSPHLGAKLAFHVQCMQCIDQLHSLPETELIEELIRLEDAVEILKVLHSLTFPTFGKYWMSKIFSLEDNILSLLPFIQQTNIVEEADTKINDGETKDESQEKVRKKPPKKSASSGYAVNIILVCVKMSGNVQHLVKHRDAILGAMRGAASGRFVEEVHEWMRPLGSLTDGNEVIVKCMHFLKAGFDKLEWNTLMTSGPGLCTTLRLLCNLTGVNKDSGSKEDSSVNIKVGTQSYCTALEVFSGGGLTVLTDSIGQLNKCFTYPCYSQHALTTVLSFNFHCLITNLAVNLLELVRHLLNILLSTSDGRFQSGYLTKLLLHLYSGMYVVLRESSVEELDTITALVVSILGIIMKKLEGDSEDDRSKILSEIISNMQESCQFMVPGMIILSHLLPLPLPVVIGADELEVDAINTIMSCRSSWEEPLNHVLGELTSYILTTLHSKCLPLLEVLIPLIQQIMDLSSNLSTNLLSTVIDSCVTVNKLTETISTTENQKEEKVTEEVLFNSHQLLILSEIVTQPSAKATLLSIMSNNQNNNFNTLWKVAHGECKNKPQIIEAALKLANVLLDSDIAFSSSKPGNEELTLQESHIIDILNLATDALGSPDLQTIFNALSCLISASCSEFSFKEIRSLLIKHPSAVNNTLETIVKKWANETELSVTNLLFFCHFIKCMRTAEKERASCFTKAEIKSILRWNKEFSTGTHPLMTLKLKLQEMELNDEIAELKSQALDEVTVLCQSLKTSQSLATKQEGKKQKLEGKASNSEGLPLEKHFKDRLVSMHQTDDSVFASRFAILLGNTKNSFSSKIVKSKDKTTVDLQDIAEKFCTGFNLEKSLKELTESAKTTDIDKIRTEAKAKRLKKLETFSTRHGKTMTFIKRSHGLMNTVPRGRGRGRGGMSSGRHYDLFRQRKQNTSRPPSMHVDDFVAADEEDGGEFPASLPTTSPSYPPSRRISRPFKRDFIPRGRGGRGASRGAGLGRGSFSNFTGTGANTEPVSAMDKFRTRNLSNRMPERFTRGRGRSRDLRSFTPRDNFKMKPQQSWGFTPRNFGGNFGSYRGGRAKTFMRIGRPVIPHSPMGFNNKWGGPPRRGRGYGKPRGKHIRSFTR